MRLTDKTPLTPYKPQSVLLLREKVHKEWILFSIGRLCPRDRYR